MDPIYLDHNSTSPIDPRVAKAVLECFELAYVNPASAHRPGQLARRKLEELRSQIIEGLGGETKGRNLDQLVFTSGGTESNNLALFGLTTQPPGRVIVSAIEHPSVIGSAEILKLRGHEVVTLPVNSSGVCEVDALVDLLNDNSGITQLVSVMLANNETGVIQPIKQIVEVCRDKGVLTHVDAVQAVAKIDVDFRELGCDAMTFTAHKFQGPRGIGGLLMRPEIVLNPILFGGFQQMAMRPGTEDVALVVGMARALELYFEQPNARQKHLATLRDQLETSILTAIPDAVVNGQAANRVPHTLNISFPGINRQAFLMAADLAGLAISTGSACASGSSDPSPVLVAMGASKDVIEGSIRISVGPSTTASEIEESARRILLIHNDLRKQK